MKLYELPKSTWALCAAVVLALILFPEEQKRRRKKRQKPPPSMSGPVMTCSAWQISKSKKTGKPIHRCWIYDPTCKVGCRVEPAPKPPKPGQEKEHERQIQKIARSISTGLARDANEELKEGLQLWRDVMSSGGIAPHGDSALAEEYSGIPQKFKRKSGQTADQIAGEMGMDERELMSRIEKDTERRDALPQGRTYFRGSDFMGQALTLAMREV